MTDAERQPVRAVPASAFRAPTDEEQQRLRDINHRISKAAFDATRDDLTTQAQP